MNCSPWPGKLLIVYSTLIDPPNSMTGLMEIRWLSIIEGHQKMTEIGSCLVEPVSVVGVKRDEDPHSG